MAGNPTNEITISIYPSTAIFSAHYVDNLAGSGIDVTFTNSDCTVSSNYLVYETETSCSGGNTLTITAYGHQYIVSPINDNIIVNLPTQNLYAWDVYDLKGDETGDVYYTLTDTITDREPCYDEYGQQMTNLWITSSGDVQGA